MPDNLTQNEINYNDILDKFTLNLSDIYNKEYSEDDFVLPGLPLGTLGVLSGAGGTGKGFWLLSAMVQVAVTGFCDFKLYPTSSADAKVGSVLYISLEDTNKQLSKRIKSLVRFWDKEDIEKSNWIKEVFDNKFIDVLNLAGETISILDDLFIDALIRRIKNMHYCRLVVIDTFRRSGSFNENDNGEVSLVLKKFEKLAKYTNAAVLLVHHEAKGASGDENAGQSALRGASALADNSRWIMRMQKMTYKEAEKRGIDCDTERTSWVRITSEKCSYAAEMPSAWLHRQEGGILIADTPPDYKEKNENTRKSFASNRGRRRNA